MRHVLMGVFLCVALVYSVVLVHSVITGKKSHDFTMFDIAVRGIFLFLVAGFVIFGFIRDVPKTLSILLQ